MTPTILVSGIGAVVKVIDSHPCGWGSIPGKSCIFLIVSLSKGLSLCSMWSEQNVKDWMPRGFSLTSSLLLDYHIKQQYITDKTYLFCCVKKTDRWENQCLLPFPKPKIRVALIEIFTIMLRDERINWCEKLLPAPPPLFPTTTPLQPSPTLKLASNMKTYIYWL